MTYFSSPNKPHPSVYRLRQPKSAAYLSTRQLPLPGKLLPALQSQAERPPPPGVLPNLDSGPALPTTAQKSWPVTASPKANVWPHTAPFSGPNTAWRTGDTQTPNSRTESKTAGPEPRSLGPNPGVTGLICTSFGGSPAAQVSQLSVEQREQTHSLAPRPVLAVK